MLYIIGSDKSDVKHALHRSFIGEARKKPAPESGVGLILACLFGEGLSA
jgi:hypothetical protein